MHGEKKSGLGLLSVAKHGVQFFGKTAFPFINIQVERSESDISQVPPKDKIVKGRIILILCQLLVDFENALYFYL